MRLVSVIILIIIIIIIIIIVIIIQDNQFNYVYRQSRAQVVHERRSTSFTAICHSRSW